MTMEKIPDEDATQQEAAFVYSTEPNHDGQCLTVVKRISTGKQVTECSVWILGNRTGLVENLETGDAFQNDGHGSKTFHYAMEAAQKTGVAVFYSETVLSVYVIRIHAKFFSHNHYYDRHLQEITEDEAYHRVEEGLQVSWRGDAEAADISSTAVALMPSLLGTHRALNEALALGEISTGEYQVRRERMGTAMDEQHIDEIHAWLNTQYHPNPAIAGDPSMPYAEYYRAWKAAEGEDSTIA